MLTSGVHYVTCAMGHRFAGSMAHATPHLHSATWQTIVESGTPSLLTNLWERCNIAASRRSSLELKPSIHDDLNCLAERGATDMPIEHRYRDPLLRVAGDPEVGQSNYAQGVAMGPLSRMPRLPLFKPKQKRTLAEQAEANQTPT